MKKENNELTLKEALQAMVESYRLKPKLNQSRIKSIWEKLMGPTIAGYTADLRIRGKKLYVTIESASLRQELSYGREKLKKMINEELGEEYLKDVVIR